MILVSVFLIRLRDNAAQPSLLLALAKHEGVLRSRPLLKGCEVEPIRRPVLVHVVDGMAGRQMPVRIQFLDKGPSGARPLVVPVSIEIITEVPGYVREGAESRNGILDESMLVRASLRGMNAAVIHVQDQRKDHVPIAGKAKCPFDLLPIGHLKAAVVEAGMIDVLGRAKSGHGIEHSATQTKSVALPGTSEKVEVAHPCRGRPWGDERCPAATRHDRLAVEHAGPSRNRYPDPIDLQPVEPFDARTR